MILFSWLRTQDRWQRNKLRGYYQKSTRITLHFIKCRISSVTKLTTEEVFLTVNNLHNIIHVALKPVGHSSKQNGTYSYWKQMAIAHLILLVHTNIGKAVHWCWKNRRKTLYSHTTILLPIHQSQWEIYLRRPPHLFEKRKKG